MPITSPSPYLVWRLDMYIPRGTLYKPTHAHIIYVHSTDRSSSHQAAHNWTVAHRAHAHSPRLLLAANVNAFRQAGRQKRKRKRKECGGRTHRRERARERARERERRERACAFAFLFIIFFFSPLLSSPLLSLSMLSPLSPHVCM